MAKRNTKIKIIGLPCDQRPLPRELTEEITSADVLGGGKKNIDRFPDARGEKIVLSSSLASFLENIRARYENQKKIVILTTGDPMIFGPVKNLLKVFDRSQLEIINTVSPLQLALARLGKDIEDSVIFSLHGRKERGSTKAEYFLERVFYFSMAIIYTDSRNNPGTVATLLINLEKTTRNWSAAVCERLGEKDERIIETTVGGLIGKKFNYPNILVIFNPHPFDLKRPGNFGLPDESFSHSGGMITHSEIRAVALSKLELSGTSTMWDVGAGSGSVGIEANQLYGLKVFLVEKDKKRFEELCLNCKAFGSQNLIPVEGNIISAAKHLPDPDRIFVGGGGEKLIDIFDLCYRRLKPGGKIVLNVITLNSITALFLHLVKNNHPFNACNLNVSRSSPIKNQMYLKAENAVTIFTVSKGN